MGSDHRLCVVSTQLNCRTTHHVPRGIPHLRDWSSTLLRVHVDLCQWSSDVCCWLDGVVPCDVATRGHSAWHAPRQRCFPRRSQPPWWTPECYATCVARNGAWRDYRRVHTLIPSDSAFGPAVLLVALARPSLPGSPARTLVLPLPPFDALFAALLLPEVILLRKSGFLQTQTVLFRNTRSWTVGGHTSPASVHVVPRLMMRFSSPSRPGLMRLFPLPSSPALFDAFFPHLSCVTH